MSPAVRHAQLATASGEVACGAAPQRRVVVQERAAADQQGSEAFM
jgi:hypothetical protein